MQYGTSLFYGLAVLSHVSSHMYLSHPPPRNSSELFKLFGLKSPEEPDYDIAAPLGKAIPGLPYRPYPCIGHKQYGDKTVATYQAGSLADIKIGGTVPHNGGHCQMSISYDEKTFVAIGNMYDDCSAPGHEKYKIKIPSTAPSGHAILAWTWINRSGGPEFYMNCADVNIKGQPNGYIEGHEVLIRGIDASLRTNFTVGNRFTVPFPEWYPKGYNVNFFSATNKYRITPKETRRIDTEVKTEVYISESEKKRRNPNYNPASVLSNQSALHSKFVSSTSEDKNLQLATDLKQPALHSKFVSSPSGDKNLQLATGLKQPASFQKKNIYKCSRKSKFN